MPELERQSEPTGCPIGMYDGRPCGRPIYPAPSDVDEQPVCLMHSRDQRKDAKAFRDEIDAILAGTSRFHRSTERFDFSSFVFLATDFRRVKLTQWADFSEVMFTKTANFVGAVFSQRADFSRAVFSQRANFVGARFGQRADFSMAMFIQGADFRYATFTGDASFAESLWGPGKDDPVVEEVELAIADFRNVKFLKPELVWFLRPNVTGRQGFRARFVSCLIKGVLFEDVDWHRENGRMVLQDELDRLANAEGAASYEQVATAYRRFVINFDEAKHYDLSEDCMIGAMEMKRLDPAQPFFARLAVNFYRLASNYGSSYQRALGGLGIILVVFGLLYSLVGLTPRFGRTVLEPVGLIHAVEVATFQSETYAIAGSGFAWLLEILERILIPAQVALFLLALRRRFRR